MAANESESRMASQLGLRMRPDEWRKALPVDWEVLLGGVLFLELGLFCILFTSIPPGNFSFSQHLNLDFAFGQKEKAGAGFFVFAAFWGAIRAFYTHPLCHIEYRKWLRSSPWKPGNPLPKGNVFLMSRDGLLLALLSLWVIWRGGLGGVLYLVIGFLAGYLAAMAFHFFVLNMERNAHSLAWTGLVLILLEPGKWVSLVVLVILLIIAWKPIHESIVRAILSEFAAEGSKTQLQYYQRLGWPYQDLAPETAEHAIAFASIFASRPRVILFAAALGVLAFSAIKLQIRETGIKQPFVQAELFFVLPAVVVGMIRVPIWLKGIRAPISLWGRIATRKLLFWRYDRVFVTPMIGLAVALGFLAVSNIVEYAWIWALPISTITVILINGLGLPKYHEFLATHCGRLGLLLKDRELTGSN